MNHAMNMVLFLLLSNLIVGCEVLPEGPVTPDNYRPPEPTQESIENMVRNAILNMVFIKGGSYMMGNVICYSEKKDELLQEFQITHMFCRTEEGPLHKVTLDSFHLSKYEISYYEYDLFTQTTHRSWIQERYLNPKWWRSRDRTMEAVISRFSGTRTGKLPAAIDWFQASDYCRWLGVVTGLPVDLPTEAEWEYAARNRNKDFPFATDNGRVERGRNYPSEENDKIQPVNSYPPSPLGLHHMSFNVEEWVRDWYDESYYKISPEKNPQGPKHGAKKILKGGIKGNAIEFNHNFARIAKDIDYTHAVKWYKSLDIKEGTASLSHGARCAIHLAKPIDIDNLKIDLSRPAPDSRAEWLATKDARTADAE